jgi:hypothetical protein
MYGYDGSMQQLYYYAGLIGAIRDQATVVLSEEGEKEFQDRKNIRVKGIGLLILILRALVGTLV